LIYSVKFSLMATKTLGAVIIFIFGIMMLPIVFGIVGGIFGAIIGIFGAIFGGIFGLIGGFFGMIGGLFSSIFDGAFGWCHFGWGSNNFLAIALVIFIVVLLSKNKQAKR
jgi:hypothetical protein